MTRKTIRTLGFAAVLPAMALLLPSTVTAQDAGIRSRPGQYAGTPAAASYHRDNPAVYDTPVKNIKRLHWLIDSALKQKIALDNSIGLLSDSLAPNRDWRARRGSHGQSYRPRTGRLFEQIAEECNNLGNMIAKSQDRVHALEGQVIGMDRSIADLEKTAYDLKCERDELLEENRRLRAKLDHRPRRYGNRRTGNIGGWSFTWGD